MQNAKALRKNAEGSDGIREGGGTMISRENYLEPHIRELQNSSKGDPGLIERTLYAFGLLEALRRVGTEFTFKPHISREHGIL